MTATTAPQDYLRTVTDAAAPLSVRPAQEHEAAEVAWLAALTFPLACPPETATEEMALHIAAQLTPAHFTRWATSEEHRLLVAERPGADGQALVGYALLRLGPAGSTDEAAVLARATSSPGPYVELSKIYAHPAALGSGTSSALMEGAVEAARNLAVAHGFPSLPLWLGTNKGNARAQSFYRKHGFVVVGERTYEVGGRQHDDVVMLRRS